jgi:hypothetical protein
VKTRSRRYIAVPLDGLDPSRRAGCYRGKSVLIVCGRGSPVNSLLLQVFWQDQNEFVKALDAETEVASTAVAAIAMCHGLEALLLHRALQEVRRSGLGPTPRALDPKAVSSGGTTVKFPSRQPNR